MAGWPNVGDAHWRGVDRLWAGNGGGGGMSRWVRMAAVAVVNLVASSQGSEQSHVN